MIKTGLMLLAFFIYAPALLADHHSESLSGEVALVSEEYGNLDTNIMQKPFEALGIKQGDQFQVTVGNKTVSVLYGKGYSDVERGGWVAFITDYGNVRIARNYASAAEGLNASVGNIISLSVQQTN